MATKVLVPRLGEGVEEVTVTKWLKREGESVNELEPLLEVNTDKVDTEVPSPAAGTVLKIVAQEGVPARVGSILAFIGKPGESLEGAAAQPEAAAAKPAAPAPAAQPEAASRPAAAAPAPQAAPASRAAAPARRELGFISPVVAKIAAERGVDLAQVQGTGLEGRITKNDVLRYAEGDQRGAAAAPAPAAGAPAPQVKAGAGDRVVPHTLMRRQIAGHMVASVHDAPHVLTVMEADMSRVTAHRQANQDQFARDGVRLTYTAYFIAAIVAGLKAYPTVNSTWTEEGLVLHSAVNVGMAVSLGEDGLIVPVIKGADNLSLLAIARAVNDLGDRARARRLQPDEVRGGTFTLTNHGTAGSLFAMPIINQPQCGILGTGVLQKRVAVVTDEHGNDAIAIRPTMYLSFVFDHRILDGASADTFLARVKSTLEEWA